MIGKRKRTPAPKAPVPKKPETPKPPAPPVDARAQAYREQQPQYPVWWWW